jgi:hypothetical protein
MRRHLLAVPAISPEWELSAFQALIKPQMRGPILYRSARQPWSARSRRIVSQASREFLEALNAAGVQGDMDLEPFDFPPAGDYRAVARVWDTQMPAARALAVLLSRRIPDVWLVLGRLFIVNGRFYRRQRGYKLRIVEATNVHLPRPLRAAVEALLKESHRTPCRKTPSSASRSRRASATR